ncbi:MAG: hypothetical protein HOC23_20745 [Halieaceae bacterium]|jgi:uncharacterized pyridoxamine 5'-phosphate oxidase family protein|nr:hypothetical protein [Halieaceae bacterium]
MLSNCHHATLSTIRCNDGLISSNTVGYVWNGEQLRISTLKNRMKYKNLVANPSAIICVIAPNNASDYVEIRGDATLEDDPDRSFFCRQYIAGAGVEPVGPENRSLLILLHFSG